MVTTAIINPDGTTVLIGGLVTTGSVTQDYTGCYIVKGEYSDEYQGTSQVKVTIYANRSLPVTLGARIFSDESDGAGGYILLSPPAIERIAANYFIYEFTFMGAVHLLETKLLFNQDAKGEGWNTTFPLVGTATDFLTLICVNMNRTQPIADPIVETWAVGTVDDITNHLLVEFDNDNCLTALKKVSEAFGLPYRVSVGESAVITLDLTSECRVHDHVFSIGSGLSKFKITGDSDRPFASALFVQGGMQNIPYDYRGCSRRLRAVSGELGSEEEVVYDDGVSMGSWNASKGNTVTGVNVNFSDVNAVYHGTSACKIYPNTGVAITGQIVQIINAGTPYGAADGVLHLWVYLESAGAYDFTWSKLLVGVIDNGTQKNIEIGTGMYGFSAGNAGVWQEVIIPLADFGLTDYLIEGVTIKTTGIWAVNAILHLDYIYISLGNIETDSFIYNKDDIAEHGRIEAAVINEDIYPRGKELAITSVESQYAFIDSSIDFDLNAKDGDGKPVYQIIGIQPKIHFISGNLSGYSFAMKAFTTATKQIELVPYTEDSGNPLPGELGGAYGIQIGDKYVITEINMPDAYVTDAEEDLLEWGQGQYTEYAAYNEVAEVEIDPVWVKEATGLQYTLLGESPVTHYDISPLVDLFMAGDLLTITIDNLYSRQLRVQQVSHEFFSGGAVWKVTLGNNTTLNLAGKIVGEISAAQNRISTTSGNLKLVKYYVG